MFGENILISCSGIYNSSEFESIIHENFGSITKSSKNKPVEHKNNDKTNVKVGASKDKNFYY